MKKYSLILLLWFPLLVMFNATMAQNTQVFTDIVVKDINTIGVTFEFSRLYTGDETKILSAGLCISKDASTYGKKYADGNVREYGTIVIKVEDIWQPNTVYYVRAYIQTEKGTSYSNPAKFKTEVVTVKNYEYPQGAVRGYFSVSPTKKVCFGKGNLQYNAVVGTHLNALGEVEKGSWRFASHQWESMDKYNINASSTYNGWIDRFAWGASGYNNIYPWGDGIKDYSGGTIAGTNYDWGVYNAISNGGNKPGIWRTLSEDEWHYLLWERPYAIHKVGEAKIEGVSGYVLLPDDWILPDGVNFASCGCDGGAWSPYRSMWGEEYTASIWEKMEANGAIFIPVDVPSWTSTSCTKGDCAYARTPRCHYSLSRSRFDNLRSSRAILRLVHDLE